MEDRTARFGLDPFNGRAAALWQGTIISNENKDLRLVVSADCDLAPTKRSESFFYLDVLTTDVFSAKYATPDSARDRLETILEAAQELAANRNNAFQSVQPKILNDWLCNGERARWHRDLQGAHPAELDLLDALANAARIISSSTANRNAPPPTQVKLNSIYIACENSQQQKKITQINKKIREHLMSRLQSSRLDHFILPEMPGGLGTGHYVPFRSISAMDRDEVCEGRIELAEYPSKFYPIATCRPVLLQALLQRFSTYFMRIGFTDQFKTQQDQVAKAALENIK